MIFPHNIETEVSNSKKLSGRSKTQFYVTGTVIVLVLSYFFIKYAVTSLLGFSSSIANFLYTAVAILAAVFIFRFAIFKEDEKLEEAKSADTESFSKFINVRKDIEQPIQIGTKIEIPSMEFVNASSFVVLNLKFGENNKSKSVGTAIVLKKIIHTLLEAGYEFRFFICKEEYDQSIEYQNYLNGLNNITNKNLAKTLIQIAEIVIQKSIEESNVDTIYLMIRSRNSLQRIEFAETVQSILLHLSENIHAFRSYNFLDKTQFFEFVKTFNGLEALDFALMKVASIIDDNAVEEDSNKAELITLETTDGQVIQLKPEVKNRFRLKERKLIKL